MAKKNMTLELAEEIVGTRQQVDSLRGKLQVYSDDWNKLDGTYFSVQKLSDSRQVDARRMIDGLSQEDQQAINQYIVRKVKSAIKDGEKRLAELGVK